MIFSPIAMPILQWWSCSIQPVDRPEGLRTNLSCHLLVAIHLFTRGEYPWANSSKCPLTSKSAQPPSPWRCAARNLGAKNFDPAAVWMKIWDHWGAENKQTTLRVSRGCERPSSQRSKTSALKSILKNHKSDTKRCVIIYLFSNTCGTTFVNIFNYQDYAMLELCGADEQGRMTNTSQLCWRENGWSTVVYGRLSASWIKTRIWNTAWKAPHQTKYCCLGKARLFIAGGISSVLWLNQNVLKSKLELLGTNVKPLDYNFPNFQVPIWPSGGSIRITAWQIKVALLVSDKNKVLSKELDFHIDNSLPKLWLCKHNVLPLVDKQLTNKSHSASTVAGISHLVTKLESPQRQL